MSEAISVKHLDELRKLPDNYGWSRDWTMFIRAESFKHAVDVAGDEDILEIIFKSCASVAPPPSAVMIIEHQRLDGDSCAWCYWRRDDEDQNV